VNRAWAVLEIKSIDEATRRIRGTASTPTPDRSGDVVEPLGARFPPEIPLLLHHRKETPVGVARLTATRTGIEFDATLPTIAEDGAVKAEVDRAWTSIQHKLIRGISIGFRVVDDAVEALHTGGLRFLKTEILELSLVSVPAHQDASLSIIKSLDLAASGLHSPGVTGLPVVHAVKAAKPMTTNEQITQFENTRAAKAARMTELMTKAAETGSTLDDAQTQEYDGLALEVKSVDAHLVRLHDQEKLNLVAATKITTTADPVKASELRGGAVPVIQVKSLLPKGTAFTRMCIALARGKGDSYQTLQIAKSWRDSTPEVEAMVEHMWHTKAAVAAGTTTDATWAGPLVVTQPLNEFLELLRPRTLLGSIPGLRHVPFNISVPSQTSGGTYGWVGQGLAKPVTKAAYATVTLPFAKAAGIIVLTEELVRLSTPSAEGLVREEMIAGMAQFLDTQFVDPTVAVAANVSPASITNGGSTAAASGVTSAAAKLDLATSVAVFTAANIPLSGSVWLMSDSNAFGLAMSVNALGQPLFPGMSITGGSIFGIPVIVSNNVGNRIILLHAPSVLFADDGGVSIDVSREASVQMDSAPDSPATATTVLVSLWQNNLVGLRAERWITWKLARTAAVRYISAAAYVGT
jgi:HK97 family phage major capsid protein/HK97 family phage prohead protease